jgi:hypothetical protein
VSMFGVVPRMMIMLLTMIMNVRMAVPMFVTMLMVVIVLFVLILVFMFVFIAHGLIVLSSRSSCAGLDHLAGARSPGL